MVGNATALLAWAAAMLHRAVPAAPRPGAVGWSAGHNAMAKAPPRRRTMFTDAATATLTVVGPQAGATAGEPIESVLEVYVITLTTP